MALSKPDKLTPLSQEDEKHWRRKLLKNFLRMSFQPNSNQAEGLYLAAQVDLAGAMGGNWIITVENQKIFTKQGIAANPDITLKMTDTDFVALVNGKLCRHSLHGWKTRIQRKHGHWLKTTGHGLHVAQQKKTCAHI